MLSTAATLLDGNPSNNFLKRAGAFNPDGRAERRRQPRDRRQLRLHAGGSRTGGRRLSASRCSRRSPRRLRRPRFGSRRSIAVQFRYAFITDADGVKVVDITVPERRAGRRASRRRSTDARGIYVARTYAYVAAGSQGIVIVDVERPEAPTNRPDVQRRRRAERRSRREDRDDQRERVRATSPTARTGCACSRWSRPTRRRARSASARGRRRR